MTRIPSGESLHFPFVGGRASDSTVDPATLWPQLRCSLDKEVTLVVFSARLPGASGQSYCLHVWFGLLHTRLPHASLLHPRPLSRSCHGPSSACSASDVNFAAVLSFAGPSARHASVLLRSAFLADSIQSSASLFDPRPILDPRWISVGFCSLLWKGRFCIILLNVFGFVQAGKCSARA